MLSTNAVLVPTSAPRYQPMVPPTKEPRAGSIIQWTREAAARFRVVAQGCHSERREESAFLPVKSRSVVASLLGMTASSQCLLVRLAALVALDDGGAAALKVFRGMITAAEELVQHLVPNA